MAGLSTFLHYTFLIRLRKWRPRTGTAVKHTPSYVPLRGDAKGCRLGSANGYYIDRVTSFLEQQDGWLSLGFTDYEVLRYPDEVKVIGR